jgi:diacylglycerol kinase family enzyme
VHDANAIGGFLVINPRSGRGRPDVSELREEADRLGIETHVLAPEDDAAALARNADGPLGVAGGDGSLAAVAEIAIERDVPFVVVPSGTRNHFARDLGLDPDDPLAALQAFSGHPKPVDAGRVNERLFLNNVSLGLYARLVHRRERHRRRREAFARLRALGMLLRSPAPLGVTIDGRATAARVVLVANNRYTLELFSVGERDRLDEGRLHLYVARDWLPTDWDDERGERFTIDARAGRLRAAVDGEPDELETPVRFEIQPRALRVLLPKG